MLPLKLQRGSGPLPPQGHCDDGCFRYIANSELGRIAIGARRWNNNTMLKGFLAVAFMFAAEPTQPPHIGGYVPNSQLLSWCKSQEPSDFQQCWSFIEGVIEATGMPDTKWPKGPIELPPGVLGYQLIPTVVHHLEGLGSEKMSGPAVRSVYDAVVAVHPYKAPRTSSAKTSD